MIEAGRYIRMALIPSVLQGKKSDGLTEEEFLKAYFHNGEVSIVGFFRTLALVGVGEIALTNNVSPFVAFAPAVISLIDTLAHSLRHNNNGEYMTIWKMYGSTFISKVREEYYGKN